MILEKNKGKHGKGIYYVCTCDWCGKRFERMKSEFSYYKNKTDCTRNQFCNARCYGDWKIKHYTAWNKGKIREQTGSYYKGFSKTMEGYKMLYNPNYPTDERKYILEHRFIMELILGRKLEDKEFVHHNNGIRDDNRPENLCIVNNNNHERGTFVKILQKRILELESLVISQNLLKE